MKKTAIIPSCMKGVVKPIKESKDASFAQGLSGEGVLITPTFNKIIAPFQGRVVIVFETKHAIILRREDGLACVIHVGVGDAHIGKGGFHVFVHDGDDVKAGDVLMEMDFSYLHSIQYDIDTHILFPSLGCRSMEEIKYGNIDYMEHLCTIR